MKLLPTGLDYKVVPHRCFHKKKISLSLIWFHMVFVPGDYPFVPKKNLFLLKRGNKEKTVLSSKPHQKGFGNLAVPHNMLNSFRFVTNQASSICKTSTMRSGITAKLL